MNQSRLLAFVALASTVVGSQGCIKPRPTESDGGPTIAEACAASAEAYCSAYNTCSDGYLTSVHYGTEEACVSRQTATCIADADSTGSGLTPARLESCAALYPSDSCSELFDGQLSGDCQPLAGGGANGSACQFNGQCSSDWCDTGPDAICGVCNTPPTVTTTSTPIACAVDNDCGVGNACAIPSGQTTGTCSPRLPVGSSCLAGVYICAAFSTCVGSNPATHLHGTCQTTGSTVGAVCDRADKTKAQCATDLGLSCIPNAAGSNIGTCQKITLVGPGETCGALGGSPITGQAACENGGLCVKASPSDNTGTCVAAAMDDTACNSDPTVGPPCLPTAACVPGAEGTTAGTCTVATVNECVNLTQGCGACTCNDGTCPTDAQGDCDDGQGECNTNSCNCNDNTSPTDAQGDCDDNQGECCTFQCQGGAGGCGDGTCPTDAFGNCADNDGECCELCECNDGTCGDSAGNCANGPSCA